MLCACAFCSSWRTRARARACFSFTSRAAAAAPPPTTHTHTPLPHHTPLPTKHTHATHTNNAQQDVIFGSVSRQDVADAVFQQTGRSIAELELSIPDIKEVGSYEIGVKLHP